MRIEDRSARALAFSWPIALLAIGASLAGILLERPYANESPNWEGQAVGQDFVNVVFAYPALLILAAVARRESLRAFLAWTGVLAYSAYTFAIYAFAITFGPLFLVYVAVFGLSVYALVMALTSLDPSKVGAAFSDRVPARSTGILLIVLGTGFYLLWLSEITPATLADVVPPTLREAQLATNPVYVLDMALLLPAAILGGVLLLRRRPLGFVLTPVVLTAMILIALGIVAAMVVLGVRGEPAPVGVTIGIGVLAAVQLGFLLRFLRSASRASVTEAREHE